MHYFNHKILIIIFSVSYLLIYSCSSPLDVPANRNIEIKDGPYKNPQISLNPTFVNFDFVLPDSTKLMTMTVSNNLTTKILITDYSLYFNYSYFLLFNKNVPFVLDAKGGANSTVEIQLGFKGISSGIYQDTLLFSGIFYPTGLLEAKVPYIYANSVNLGNIPLNQNSEGQIIINNLSESSATISKIRFSNFSNYFKFKNGFPIVIQRNSKDTLSFIFTPLTQGKFQENLTFEITTQAQRKLVDSVATIQAIVN